MSKSVLTITRNKAGFQSEKQPSTFKGKVQFVNESNRACILIFDNPETLGVSAVGLAAAGKPGDSCTLTINAAAKPTRFSMAALPAFKAQKKTKAAKPAKTAKPVEAAKPVEGKPIFASSPPDTIP